MRRKSPTSVLTLVALMAAFAALPARAATRTYEMDSVDASVSGLVRLQEDRRAEVLQVRVFISSAASNGADLLVSATIDGERLPIGKIGAVLRSGLLELDSRRHISPVFPLRDVQEISVSEGGRTILTAVLRRPSDQ